MTCRSLACINGYRKRQFRLFGSISDETMPHTPVERQR